MFDFSATEFLIIALVALIVIGPRELPGLLRQIGQMVGKVRRMASEFQDQLNEAVENSEIQDIKKEVGKLAEDARIDVDYNPAEETEQEIRDAVHGTAKLPAGEIKNPEHGDDPDDALVEFPSPDADPITDPKPAATESAAAKPSSDAGNAVVREPSKPRAPASARKRLPVETGATTPADSVAATSVNSDGKPTAAEG